MTDATDTLRSTAIQRSDLLVAQGREVEGLALVDEALSKLPGDLSLLYQRAWIQIRLNRHTDALQTLQQVLALAPDFVSAQHLLSVALTGIGDLPAAQEAIGRCLAAEPEDPQHHLHQALILASVRGIVGRRGRVKQAITHLRTAIALDPERASNYGRAASVYDFLGHQKEALEHVNTGLELAPDDVGLLASRSDYDVPKPRTRYDVITVPAQRVASAIGILANDPQHLGARRVLFHMLWERQSLAFDTPFILTAFVAFGVGISFASPGGATMPLLALMSFAVALFAGMRLLVSHAITKHASASYRRMFRHDLPHSALKTWLLRASWILLAVLAVLVLFVRDPIVIRWTIVALGAAALLSLAASITHHLSYPAAAQRLAAITSGPEALPYLLGQRSHMRGRIIYRALPAAVLTAFTIAVESGREDVAPVFRIIVAALFLSPLVGLIVVRRVERQTRAGLVGTADLPTQYRAPRIVSLVFALIAIAAFTVQLVASVATLPVAPNEHDVDAPYELTWTDGSVETECSGRAASRLACIQKKQQDFGDELNNLPVPTVPSFEMPDIEIPDLLSTEAPDPAP